MEYIQKLPFILGSVMAIITGIICVLKGNASKEIYIKMSVMMIIFFIIGVYLRKIIKEIYEEIERKRIEEEQILQESLENNEDEMLEETIEGEEAKSRKDYSVEHYADDFLPLNDIYSGNKHKQE